MRSRSDYGEFKSSSLEKRRLLLQEELILEVTEALTGALARSGMSRAELAQTLGKSKAFVSQVLSGGRNVTLRTLSDFADAVGARPEVRLCRTGGRPLLVVLGGTDFQIWRERTGEIRWPDELVKASKPEPGTSRELVA